MTLIGKKHKPIWTPSLLRRPNGNAALQNVRPTIKPPATMNEPQITSMSTPRPTPETDAALVDHMPKDATEWSEHYLALCIHSRKLERERDEAREQLEAMRKDLEKVCQQRDAWAMRCDKLGVTAMQEAIKDAHYALDYVYNHGEGSCAFPFRTNDDLCSENRFHHVKDALDALKPFLP